MANTDRFDKLPKWKQTLILRERKLREVQRGLEEKQKKNAGVWQSQTRGEARAQVQRNAVIDEIYRKKAAQSANFQDERNYATVLHNLGEKDVYTSPVVSQSEPTPAPSVASTSRDSFEFTNVNAHPIVNLQEEKKGNFWEKPLFQNLISGLLPAEMLEKFKQSIPQPPRRPTAVGPQPLSAKEQLNIQYASILGMGPVSRNTKLIEVDTKGHPVEPTPRYYMTKNLEGKEQPFYIETINMVEELKAQAAADPNAGWIQKELYPWVLGGLTTMGDAFTRGVGKYGITIGGGTEKELIFQEDPNTTQAFFGLMFNVGMVGGEFVQAIFQSINPFQKADGKTVFTTTSDEVDTMRKEYFKDVTESWDSVKYWWDVYQTSFNKEKNDNYDLQKVRYTEGGLAAFKAREEHNQDIEQQREAALVESERLTKEAEMAYRTGYTLDMTDPKMSDDLIESMYLSGKTPSETDVKKEYYEKAIDLQMQAIEQRRRSDPMDSWGAASWSREPERYEAFLRNAAMLELQLGRPLSISEVRRLKEQYTNMYTELAFELVFDVTNLLPLVGSISKAAGITDAMYDIGKVALKPVYQALDFLAETKVIQWADKNINVYKWLTKRSVSSTANIMQQVVHDTFMRMHGAYGSLEQMMKDMPQIESLVRDLKSMKPLEAMSYYNEVAARREILGIVNLSYSDFKRLTDLDISMMKGKTWGELMSSAIEDSKSVYETRFRKQFPDLSEAQIMEKVNKEMKRAGMPIFAFASNFGQAYKQSHVIYKGSNLMDDTVAGWMVKTARLFASDGTLGRVVGNDDWLSGTIKLTKLDDFIQTVGAHSPETARKLVYAFGSTALETAVGVGSLVRSVWTSFVLATPRWVITNFIDSSGRNMIYGGNVFDDILTLSESLQSHFVDDIGFSPLVMGASLSRSELGFADSVSVKLLYDADFKPKFGLFSYWNEERKRMKELKIGVLDSLKGNVAERVTIDNASNGNKFQALWNGFSTIVPDQKAKSVVGKVAESLSGWTRAFPGAISDYNTAIEFTLRTRMLHREYFKLLSELEPKFMELGMDALTPAAKDIAARVWRESGGNAAKLSALVDSVTGLKDELGEATWSFMLPSDWDSLLKMDTDAAQAFTHQIKKETKRFIQSVAKAEGRNPTSDEIDVFITKTRVAIQDAMQSALAEHNKLKDIDTSISTAGKSVEAPDITDLKGAAPTFSDTQVADAIKRIEKPFFKKSADVAESFKTAASRMGDVTEVAGDGLSVISKGGKVTVEIGSDFGKRNLREMNLLINEATMKALSINSKDTYLRFGIKSDEFETALRTFLKDPARVLNDNEKAFVLIADTLDANPALRRLLNATGGVASYDGAYDLYRQALDNRYAIAVLRDPTTMKQSLQQFADSVLMPTAERREAGVLRRLNHVQFMEQAKGAGTEIYDLATTFQNNMTLTRTSYHDFLILVYPGPKRLTSGAERSKMWELVQHLQAEGYKNEIRMSEAITDALKRNPEEAKAMMQSSMENFTEYYLREQGITAMWDESHTNILSLTIVRDGKKHTFSEGSMVPEYINSVFFNGATVRNSAPAIKLAMEKEIPMSRQMVVALQQTFPGVNYEQARTWTVAVSNHAKKWSEVTGQPVEAYFERLGFQYVNGTFEVDTTKAIGLVSGGMIQKTENGFQFYGGKATDFNTLVSESSFMFYDDLVEMAEYSDDMADALKRINKYIRLEGGSAVRKNKLTKTQAETFSRLFTEYMATGQTPNMKLKKSFEKFKEWIIEDFKAIKQSPDMVEDMSADAYDAMNTMFIQDKLKVKSNNSTVIDESMSNLTALVGGLPEEQKKNLKRGLLDLINANRVELNDEAKMLLDGVDNAVGDVFLDKKAVTRIAKENGVNIQPSMNTEDIVDAIRRRIAKYNDLDEVPRAELKEAIGKLPEEVRTSFSREKMDNIDEAFAAWVQRKDLKSFPDWVKQDSDTFKRYLRKRIEEEPFDIAMMYERTLYEVQNLEDVILSGKKAKVNIYQDFNMSSGVKSYLRQTVDMGDSYNHTLAAIDRLSEFLKSGDYIAPTLSEETVALLDAWRTTATKSKSDLVGILLNGGEVEGRTVKGAIDRVNEVMLDYTNQSNLDQFMKNIFPFWMFPSRSLPFWVKTIATHPQILAAYNKMKRFSRSQRLQAGAVTSQGRPQPSLEGYVNIPGTELWFNPLAPFSFKYVLGLSDLAEDLYYSASNDENIEPTSWIVRELLQTAPSAGFNVAPWTAHLMKKAFNISDSALPQFPLIPEISLVPRWMVSDLIEKANKKNFLGTPLGDSIYPEASWHDSLVERQILQDVLEQLQDPENTESKAALVEAARTAIMQKGDNPLWKETYKNLTNKESFYANMSFFTGLYPKEFTDSQADIYALRNELSLMKSALNNEFQSVMFNIPTDAHVAWKRYLDMNNTDEGDLYRIYTTLNWVRNDAGAVVSDPLERARYLNMALQDDINQKAYYQKMGEALAWLDNERGKLPIGTSYEAMQHVYDKYNEMVLEAKNTFPFDYDRSFGSNKPAELIAEDLENIYFKMLNSSRPRWNESISDEENKARIAEWEKNLPKISVSVYNAMLRQQDVEVIRRSLKPQQILPKNFWDGLLQNSTTDGIYKWQIRNDTALDALNNAWTKMYWNEYWSTVSGKSGSERDLAESDFMRMRPAPTADELYEWILSEYGPRFDKNLIYKYVNGNQPTMSIDDATLQRKGEDYVKKQQVWDYLSWLGPSKNFELIEELQYMMSTPEYGGMRNDSLSLFMDTNGKAYSPEEIKQLIKGLEAVYAKTGIQPPTREYQVKYVEAQQENDLFRSIMNERLSKNEEFMKVYEEKWKYGVMPDGSQYVRNEDPLDVIFDLQALYFDKDTKQHQNRVREDYPVEYVMMKDYWAQRATFGRQNPTWSTYYLWKPIPLPFQDIENLPYSNARRTAVPTDPSPLVDTLPTPEKVDKTIAVATPVQPTRPLKAAMGLRLYQEVQALYSQGKHLSRPGASFLYSLMKRHPEWKEEIQDILYQNNRP